MTADGGCLVTGRWSNAWFEESCPLLVLEIDQMCSIVAGYEQRQFGKSIGFDSHSGKNNNGLAAGTSLNCWLGILKEYCKSRSAHLGAAPD